MKQIRRILFGIIIAVTASLHTLRYYFIVETPLHISNVVWVVAAIMGTIFLICIVVHPKGSDCPTKPLQALDNGCELLHLFLISATIASILHLFLAIWILGIIFPWNGLESSVVLAIWLLGLILSVIVESIVF